MPLRKNRHGWMIMEILVGFGLLAIITSCIAFSVSVFGRINDVQLRKQRCLSAADAVLDCIAVTGQALDKKDIERLWPNVEVFVEKKDGKDNWQDLTLVQVTAVSKGKGRTKEVSVSVSGYIAGRQE